MRGALWPTMPDWLVILFLFELVIILTNRNERDTSWFQGLPRPAWLTFHRWSPLIRPACSLGNDHPSNRSVSSFRSFAMDVKRLQQSLTHRRRPR